MALHPMENLLSLYFPTQSPKRIPFSPNPQTPSPSPQATFFQTLSYRNVTGMTIKRLGPSLLTLAFPHLTPGSPPELEKLFPSELPATSPLGPRLEETAPELAARESPAGGWRPTALPELPTGENSTGRNAAAAAAAPLCPSACRVGELECSTCRKVSAVIVSRKECIVKQAVPEAQEEPLLSLILDQRRRGLECNGHISTVSVKTKGESWRLICTPYTAILQEDTDETKSHNPFYLMMDAA